MMKLEKESKVSMIQGRTVKPFITPVLLLSFYNMMEISFIPIPFDYSQIRAVTNFHMQAKTNRN